MDNNDSNIKSQQTGGLKLMTVFIAVLALHVVVIGGFTVYHLMSGGSTDTDTAAITDKNHKGSSTDSTSTDATATADKSTSTAAPAEVATIPASTVTPASAPAPTGDTVSPSVSTTTSAMPVTPTASTASPTTPAPSSTPALTLAQPTPAPTAATVANPTTQMPTGPIAPALLPPSDQPAPMVAPAPAPMAPAVAPAASSLAAGPVHMPPANKDASRVTHAKEQREHEQVYTVKITDSYKKIAKAHHVTVAQLKEANGIKGDTLHTGQKLFIPAPGKNELAETSALASAPTVLNASTAPMTTGLSSTSTSMTTTASGHHLYTIEKGDTLTKIAHKFKTTPSALMAANSDLDPTKLKIGKKLRIPSKEARSASNSAPVNSVPTNTIPVAQPVQPAQAQQAKSAPSTPTTGELTSFSL